MMMKKVSFIITFLLMNVFLFSQTNLVPNPYFNEVTKKVKQEGQITMAAPWISPTLANADLYVTNTKSSLIGVPENAYGEEDPMKGDNYAGILAYSYKSKEPRSYLQVKLTEPLKEGEEYCVTFHVSLSDLSKYSSNYIGAYISNNAVSANNTEVLQFEPQIVSRKLKVYKKQFYWTPVCAKYTAKGGEEFLTIGNFTPEEKLTLEKVKRPRGFTSPQTYDAYYFIDNVSVINAKEVDKCDCDFVPGMENAEVVSRNFNSDAKPAANKVKIVNTDGSVVGATQPASLSLKPESNSFVISFTPKSFSIIGGPTSKLDQLVTILKKEPDTKIMLKGYYDASEKDIEKLDVQRIMAVYKYIVSKGIKKETIKRSAEGTNDAQKDVLKNMKVVIELIRKNDDSDDTEEESE